MAIVAATNRYYTRARNPSSSLSSSVDDTFSQTMEERPALHRAMRDGELQTVREDDYLQQARSEFLDDRTTETLRTSKEWKPERSPPRTSVRVSFCLRRLERSSYVPDSVRDCCRAASVAIGSST
eukprot:scpid15025/ scgid8386/ 